MASLPIMSAYGAVVSLSMWCLQVSCKQKITWKLRLPLFIPIWIRESAIKQIATLSPANYDLLKTVYCLQSKSCSRNIVYHCLHLTHAWWNSCLCSTFHCPAANSKLSTEIPHSREIELNITVKVNVKWKWKRKCRFLGKSCFRIFQFNSSIFVSLKIK